MLLELFFYFFLLWHIFIFADHSSNVGSSVPATIGTCQPDLPGFGDFFHPTSDCLFRFWEILGCGHLLYEAFVEEPVQEKERRASRNSNRPIDDVGSLNSIMIY